MDFWIQLAVILGISLIASVEDIRRGQVSDFLLWGGTFLMIVCHVIFTGLDAWTYIAGGIFASLIFLLARVLTKRKLGLADVYFAGFAGVSLPWNDIGTFIFGACVGAGVMFLCKFIFFKKDKDFKIPFIPALAAALLVTFF